MWRRKESGGAPVGDAARVCERIAVCLPGGQTAATFLFASSLLSVVRTASSPQTTLCSQSDFAENNPLTPPLSSLCHFRTSICFLQAQARGRERTPARV